MISRKYLDNVWIIFGLSRHYPNIIQRYGFLTKHHGCDYPNIIQTLSNYYPNIIQTISESRPALVELDFFWIFFGLFLDNPKIIQK